MKERKQHIFVKKADNSSVVLKPEITVKAGDNNFFGKKKPNNCIKVPLDRNFTIIMEMIQNFHNNKPAFYSSQ